jgi:hypothetical protein
MSAANMIILAAEDNVGVALADIAAGQEARSLAGQVVKAQESIPQGHKIALVQIAKGDAVVRFGMPIALATGPILRGSLVHVHNVASRYLNNDEDHYE